MILSVDLKKKIMYILILLKNYGCTILYENYITSYDTWFCKSNLIFFFFFSLRLISLKSVWFWMKWGRVLKSFNI